MRRRDIETQAPLSRVLRGQVVRAARGVRGWVTRFALARGETPALRRLFPEVDLSEAAVATAAHDYAESHAAYVDTVSDARAAMSLAQVGLLAAILRQRRFTRVADFGSGFSSYVLRREVARTGSGVHHAIDHDPHWLDRTRAYLQARGLAANNVILWQDLVADVELTGFDFAYYDLADPLTRLDLLPIAEQRLSPDAWLVLDDMHKSHFRPRVLSMLEPRWHLVSLVALTADRFGRFAYLARRKGSAR